MRKIFFIALLFFTTAGFLTAQEKPQIVSYLDSTSVNQITGDENELWIATYGRGIYHYIKSSDKWENFSTAMGNLQQDFFYCISYNKDFVWAGCSDGLFIYDRKHNIWLKRKFGKGGEMGNWVRALAFDKSTNTLWIGRFKYLSRLELNNQRFSDIDLTVNEDAKTNNIKSIKLDGDSVAWFGTEVGIHKYNKSKDIEDPSSRQFITNKTNSFNGDGDVISLSDILFESRNIWFGLDEFVTFQKPNFNIGGIYCYNRKIDWRRFDKYTGMSANGVYCLARTGNIIWASLYEFNKKNKEQVGQGIALINRITKSVTKVSKDELNLRSDKIISMFFDGNYMWLGTEAGLLKVKITNDFATLRVDGLRVENNKKRS
ncbi:MAG: hypothetical protein Q8933_01890 [Bacteroidota bacterium]|nr:hypothetical protein [Bacteroidota bacterium]MDP4194756.1 hypothetical protein [Bacteroidota bacterium]